MSFFQLMAIAILLTLSVSVIASVNNKKFRFVFIIPIFLIVYLGYVFFFQCTYKQETIIEHSYNISALRDNIITDQKTTVALFISTTTVNQDIKYCVMIKTSRGNKVKTYNCEKTYIIEDDTEIPRVEFITYDKVVRRKSDGKVLGGWNPDFTGNYYYRVYVPEGSVVNDYNIDLQ